MLEQAAPCHAHRSARPVWNKQGDRLIAAQAAIGAVAAAVGEELARHRRCHQHLHANRTRYARDIGADAGEAGKQGRADQELIQEFFPAMPRSISTSIETLSKTVDGLWSR